jgi:hypothetical protein
MELQRTTQARSRLVPQVGALALAVLIVLLAPAGAAAAGVPENTVPPTITGTPQQGQTLTEHDGEWTNEPTEFKYQWLQCSSTCPAIPGATAASYTAGAGDVGHTIKVRVTAKNAEGSTVAISAATLPVAPPPVPVTETPPKITGTAQQGETLTEEHGTWSNEPEASGYTYQWMRCSGVGPECKEIQGATGQTYPITDADVGNTIEVQETARNAGGASLPATSAATETVAPPPIPVNEAPPTITGTAQQGQTLTEHHGTWANEPEAAGYTYQWLRCTSSGGECSEIAGATGQTYVIAAADVGHTLVVTERASNAGGVGVAATSAATAIVLPPVTVITPTLTPTPTPGLTPIVSLAPAPKPPPVRVSVPLVSQLHERLIHGKTLEVTFRLAVKARVRLIARGKHKKVLTSTPAHTFAAGAHRLLLVLNRRHWPTKLELRTHPLQPLPTIPR